MPAIITHDLFGRDLYESNLRTIGGSQDEADAFLLGNQGPDPLFYVSVNPLFKDAGRLGAIMHAEHPTQLVMALHESVEALSDSERPIGRAYALGFLSHFALDSTMHPFVRHHEDALCNAGVEGLGTEHSNEVHAVVESEFDELVLYAKRGETIATFDPSRDILKADERVLHIVSKLYAHIAASVYDRVIPGQLFTAAVHHFRIAQRIMRSSLGVKRHCIGQVEQHFRSYSFLKAMMHRPVELEYSAFENREGRAWENPCTGEESVLGFWELYRRGLSRAEDIMGAFDKEPFTMHDARLVSRGLNFSGRLVDDCYETNSGSRTGE